MRALGLKKAINRDRDGRGASTKGVKGTERSEPQAACDQHSVNEGGGGKETLLRPRRARAGVATTKRGSTAGEKTQNVRIHFAQATGRPLASRYATALCTLPAATPRALLHDPRLPDRPYWLCDRPDAAQRRPSG